jgi:hypothetical protein
LVPRTTRGLVTSFGVVLSGLLAPRPARTRRSTSAAVNRRQARSADSLSARPICCSAFRPWSASLALPTAWPTTPSADFCRAVRRPLGLLSRRNGDTRQISRGKLNRLRCTAAGSTLRAVDGYGLRDTLPARPTLAPRIRFLSIGSHLCFALPSDPASRR